MTTGTPAAEHPVDAELARALLRDQHPDLAELELSPGGSGFDNVQFRLGPNLAVRLPRRDIGATLAAHEHRWLPVLAERLSLPVPVPVRLGAPALGYPWPWAVVRWVPGVAAEANPDVDAVAAAVDLGEFLRTLHDPAPVDAPLNPFRGIALADRLDRTEATIHRLAATDVEAVRLDLVTSALRQAARTPRWAGPPVWLHGDLHLRHLLVADRRLSGVIDFGDITSGDPATDLAAAWMLLPTAAHERFRTVYGCDDDTWKRSRGWAIVFGVILLEIGLTDGDAPRTSVATTTLQRAVADFGQSRTSGA